MRTHRLIALLLFSVYSGHCADKPKEIAFTNRVWLFPVVGNHLNAKVLDGDLLTYDTNLVEISRLQMGSEWGYSIESVQDNKLIVYDRCYIDIADIVDGLSLFDKVMALFFPNSVIELWDPGTGRRIFSHEQVGLCSEFDISQNHEFLACSRIWDDRDHLFVLDTHDSSVAADIPHLAVYNLAFQDNKLFVVTASAIVVYREGNSRKYVRDATPLIDLDILSQLVFDNFIDGDRVITVFNRSVSDTIGPIILRKNEALYDSVMEQSAAPVYDIMSVSYNGFADEVLIAETDGTLRIFDAVSGAIRDYDLKDILNVECGADVYGFGRERYVAGPFYECGPDNIIRVFTLD